jgi:aspartyl-tRNA(Asn)/glutamyl-tRNA(Gln) amidotransferase subunit B
MGDLAALLKTADKAIDESPVSAKSLGELLGLIAGGELSGKLAKEVLEKCLNPATPRGHHGT